MKTKSWRTVVWSIHRLQVPLQTAASSPQTSPRRINLSKQAVVVSPALPIKLFTRLNWCFVLRLFSSWRSFKTLSTSMSARFPRVLASLLQVDFELLSSMAKLICVTLINEHPWAPTWNNCFVNLSCNEDIQLITMNWLITGKNLTWPETLESAPQGIITVKKFVCLVC